MLVIKADREKALVVLNLEKLVQLIAPILTKTTEKATDKPPHNPPLLSRHRVWSAWRISTSSLNPPAAPDSGTR